MPGPLPSSGHCPAHPPPQQGPGPEGTQNPAPAGAGQETTSRQEEPARRHVPRELSPKWVWRRRCSERWPQDIGLNQDAGPWGLRAPRTVPSGAEPGASFWVCRLWGTGLLSLVAGCGGRALLYFQVFTHWREREPHGHSREWGVGARGHVLLGQPRGPGPAAAWTLGPGAAPGATATRPVQARQLLPCPPSQGHSCRAPGRVDLLCGTGVPRWGVLSSPGTSPGTSPGAGATSNY